MEQNKNNSCFDKSMDKSFEHGSSLLDLNELYKERDRIIYWCNACGEVNLPSDNGGIVLHTEDELPEEPRQVYAQYWREDFSSFPFTHYVMTIDGDVGMASCVLFDHTYIDEVVPAALRDGPSIDPERKKAHKATRLVAEGLLGRLPQGVKILHGEESDPDGDEILIFIPSSMCDDYEKIVSEIVGGDIYSDFERLYLDLLGVSKQESSESAESV